MLILINGLPLFSKRLADDLNAFDATSKFIFCDTYNSKLQQLKFLALLPFADVVISMNGVTDNSGSLNAVLKLNKKLIMQWQGTDSLLAMERYKNGTIKRDYIDHAFHFVDSPWLFDEVTSVNCKPQQVPFKFADEKKTVVNYNGLSGMTYIADNRQAFYGIHQFKAVAENNPTIEFKLFGVVNPEVQLPSNVKSFGWVPSDVFQNHLRETPIFFRLAAHEGFPVSVIEAMSFGCEVIMTSPYANSHQAKTNEEVLNAFEKVKQIVANRNLTPNYDLINMVKSDYNKDVILRGYIEKIKSVVKS
jgi:glycosyltransferase involved in cell wall biosynthesis